MKGWVLLLLPCMVKFGFDPVSHKNMILPRGSEGRQTAFINWGKMVQFIFQLIEKPD